MISVYIYFFIGILVSLALLLITLYKAITEKRKSYKIGYGVTSSIMLLLLVYLSFSEPRLNERIEIYRKITKIKSIDIEKIEFTSNLGKQRVFSDNTNKNIIANLLQNIKTSISHQPKTHEVWKVSFFLKDSSVINLEVYENIYENIEVIIHSKSKTIGTYKNNGFKFFLDGVNDIDDNGIN